MEFKALPVVHNAQGEERKVGFELEFANVDIEESVQIIQALYGGERQVEHRFSQKVVGTRLGDFTCSIDVRMLNKRTYQKPFKKLNIHLEKIKLGEGTLEESVESALETLVSTVIPYEIGTPPVPVSQIEEFELLRKALFERKAEGTKAFPTHAFATHINLEVPDAEPATIVRYLKAFLLLYPWLLREGSTDFARRVTSFINPFPAEYAELVLSPEYHPDLATLIDDYHRLNPDRNRPLDLYPLFAALDEEQVKQYEDVGKVKPRNTFHYRLPNSQIAQEDWTLAQEWNLWVTIEELAYDPERLRQKSLEYLALRQNTLIGFESKWAKKTAEWVF